MSTDVPEKVHSIPGQPQTREQLVDRVFFGLGTIGAVWLAWAVLDATFRTWWGVGLIVIFWLVLAYLALPRLNRILTSIYVPDYFIGRTRTSDGLLGDPLNLAFRGSGEQLATAMRSAGWVLADPISVRSSLGIVASTLTRRSYAEAPVSPLLLFGRAQDAAYQQEVAGNPAQRHHVRFWRTPAGWLLPGGHRVDWLAGGTYDRRVGLSLFTLQVTHKIDADIDVERDHIVGSITAVEPQVTVEPLVDFTTGYHSRNGGGDSVHTDGTLPIVDVSAVPPAPDAPSLTPHVSVAMPLTILLPAIFSLLSAITGLVDVFTGLDSRSSDSTRTVVWVAVVLSLIGLLIAVGTLLRSNLARRALLSVSLVEVISQVWAYYLAKGDTVPLLAIYHAALSVLVLVALSSPSARHWSTGRLDSEQ